MAKTGTNTGKPKKPGRIPKRIGGLKIPKELRRTGEALIEKANTPQGREVLTAGLAMAATAAVAAIERQRTKKAAAAEPQADAAPPPKPGESGLQQPQAVADAIGQAAEMMLGRFFGKRA